MKNSNSKKKRKSYKEKREELLNEITNSFIEKLEAAKQGDTKLPWRKPWSNRWGILPQNLIYKNPYKGINLLLLMDELSPFFLTFYQIKTLNEKEENNIKIGKGTKTRKLIAYNVTYKLGKQKVIRTDGVYYFKNGNRVPNPDDIESMAFIDQKRVHSTEDLEGIAHLLPKVSEAQKAKFINERMPKCEQFVKEAQQRKRLPQIVKGSAAYYQMAIHQITMPDFKYFDSADAYYSTLFHEGIHSTGKLHERDMTGKFGSFNYAREELVAELGASMICALFGIDNDSLIENQTAYIQSWLSKLRKEPTFLLKSANAASKAANYLIHDFFTKEQDG